MIERFLNSRQLMNAISEEFPGTNWRRFYLYRRIGAIPTHDARDAGGVMLWRADRLEEILERITKFETRDRNQELTHGN